MKAYLFLTLISFFMFVTISINLETFMFKNDYHRMKEILQYFNKNVRLISYDKIFWKKGYNDKIDKKTCFRLSWNHSLYRNTKQYDSALQVRSKLSVLSNPIQSCNRYITIWKSCGRMGNQMFQVASVIGIAYQYDMIPVFPYKMLYTYFNLPNRYDADLQYVENSTICLCSKTAAFRSCKESWNSTKNVTMQGLLQSWKYFDNAKSVIKTLFRLNEVHNQNAKEFLDKVTTKSYQHVCIHVRRGDLLRKTYKKYSVPDADFVRRAMNFYLKTFQNVDFIIVSEDKFWCKTNIKNVPISPFVNAGDDMALMTLCDHVIVTAGTFGWWGGWLSGGITVYYKGYPGHNLSHKFNLFDYYPSHWIGL